MSRPTVFIANPSVPKIAFDILQDVANVVSVSGYDRESILKEVSGADAIFWASGLKLDKEILDAAGPQLRVVATMSVGYNHIDLAELKSRGIPFSNTPRVLDNAVADMALYLALGASRRCFEGRQQIEKGTWKKYFDTQWLLGRDISGSTVGIIGLGNIGQAIARRLKGFDVARILYTGHREKAEGKELGAEFVNLDTLNRESDFVFLAAPLTNETRNICNEEFFSKMKKTGIIVNIGRGELIDQAALIKALKTGEIFAAGLDVMTPEPLNTDSELLTLPNVVLTPHIGSATVDTRNAMAELTAKNILRGLAGEEMFTPIQL
ncbi:glyoxylate reductase/hydroxypyruvate reductase-like isoform X2 [Rhynchophorus ferrugineus]